MQQYELIIRIDSPKGPDYTNANAETLNKKITELMLLSVSGERTLPELLITYIARYKDVSNGTQELPLAFCRRQ